RMRRADACHHRCFTLDDRVAALERCERIERAKPPDATADRLRDVSVTPFHGREAATHHVIEALAQRVDAGRRTLDQADGVSHRIARYSELALDDRVDRARRDTEMNGHLDTVRRDESRRVGRG